MIRIFALAVILATTGRSLGWKIVECLVMKESKDFFISRAGADSEIAVWIARELESLGFTVLLQDNDFRVGESFVGNMDLGSRCERVVALLSPEYFASPHTTAEWQAGYVRDPDGMRGVLVPVRLRECIIPPLIGRLAFIDFLGRTEDERSVLLRRFLGAKHTSRQTFVSKLPTISPLLFGRSSRLKELNAAWINPDIHVVAIVAPGGVGKSSLAINWWHRNQARSAARVLGWSFYSQGAAEDRQVSADPFLDKALRMWFKVSDPPKDSWERGTYLAELVRKEPMLLILDGLEPIQYPPGPLYGRLKDPGMAALLKELAAQNPGLCICTSRFPLADLEDFVDSGVLSMDLENLTPEDGAAYLRALNVVGPDAELREASSEFGNHALALTLLGRYLHEAFDGDVRKRDEIPDLFAEPNRGGHARRVMRQYEALYRDKPELLVLRMLSLFDRPADVRAIAVLRKLPFFSALATDRDWNLVLGRLRDARLLYDAEKDAALDCHPLIREHFADEFRRSHADAFREAHCQLYESYAEQSPHRPDTLEEMTPLFYAVYHGCNAGRHSELFDKIYFDRVLRREECFLWKMLGAFGANLSLLDSFFESSWTVPVAALRPTHQPWLIREAAFSLRALGRLAEAEKPMELAARAAMQVQDWKQAAIGFGNLSSLQASLGFLAVAIDSARTGIELAERGAAALEPIKNSTRLRLASALYRAGHPDEAARIYEESEGIQARIEPERPLLHGVGGYRTVTRTKRSGNEILYPSRLRWRSNSATSLWPLNAA